MVRSRADEKFRVIDSELREYGVADARIAGPGNRIARWTPLIQPQTVYVDLDLEVIGQLSLGEAKERVLAVLNGAPDFWDAYDIEEMRTRISTASSSAELVKAIPG